MVSYSMYEPEKGEKLEFNDICDDDILVVQENLLAKLDNSTDIDSFFYLAGQNIDIFNLSNAFYTDICYHFESPIEGKDIALKDRIKLYYPNVTLCEDGCQIKGVNLTTFKAMCECLLNNFMGDNLLSHNILYKSSIGELESMIKKTNIEVIKCYKDLFDSKYYINNFGSYIILFLLIIQIILAIIYFSKSLYPIRKYILSITDKYLSFLSSQKKNVLSHNNNNSLLNQENKFNKRNEPPKKTISIDKNNNEEKEKVKRKKSKKGKTHNLKNKKRISRINKLKVKSIQPYKYKLKNDILENRYKNEIISNNYGLIESRSSETDSQTSKNLNSKRIPKINKKKKF